MHAEHSRNSLLITISRISKRWKPPAIVFTAMFGVIALFTFLLPNQYQSRVKILVKNARLNPIVSLDQQTQGVLYVDEVSEARINTEIELLTSSDVLREVVTRCHLADFVKTGSHNLQTRSDLALRQLQKELSVTAVRKSDVIEASYQSPDPLRSAAVMRAVSDLYLQAHLQVHGSPDTYSFFSKIHDGYAGQLQQAESDLAKFRQAHSIVALPEEKTLALQQATDLQKSLAESAAATHRSEQQADHLQKVLTDTPVTIEKERRSFPNQNALDQLAVVLLTLKNKRAEAAQRYLPDDRIMQELDAQIKQTQSAFEAARDNKSQEVVMGANPALLSAEDEHIKASADYAGNQAQTQTLSHELQANRARLVHLDQETVPYQNMVRRVTQLEELTDFYKKKSDEARVNDLLDRERISNVTVAEQPTPAEVPSSPKRGLILALGFVWSLLVSIATAFGLDLLTPRIFSPYELEEVPGLPLLASLPALAIAPSFGGAFPSVYMSMQRRTLSPVRRQP